jgi:hypothetical protein
MLEDVNRKREELMKWERDRELKSVKKNDECNKSQGCREDDLTQ